MSSWDSWSFAHSEETQDHMWYCVGSRQRPVTSLDPKFWCYLIRCIGRLWGHSWSSLATGIAVWSHSQIFFVLPMSGTCKLFNSVLHHLSHSALHQLFYYILLSTSKNKSTLSTLQELYLESWISIHKCPARTSTNFPQEPTARSPSAYLTSTITLGIQQTACPLRAHAEGETPRILKTTIFWDVTLCSARSTPTFQNILLTASSG